MIVVNGKNGIYAKVLKHSIGPSGVHLLTFEVAYPRIVLAELNTHGMVCKNSASSRAIPFDKMVENLIGRPVRFGANQAGMQDKGEDYDAKVGIGWTPEEAWEGAKEEALNWSEAFFQARYHKQVYNRLTEPFQMMKTVLTATEWANFFWLRNHEAADPTLAELARVMYEAAKQSKPEELKPGEWHLPYVDTVRVNDVLIYKIKASDDDMDYQFLNLEDAKRVSAARCAAVSFRNVDYGVEKSREVYDRLLSDQRKHGSAFQHQGTPTQNVKFGTNSLTPATWEEGVTHMDRQYNLWSAQFREWIMLRKLIKGENVPGFLPPDA